MSVIIRVKFSLLNKKPNTSSSHHLFFLCYSLYDSNCRECQEKKGREFNCHEYTVDSEHCTVHVEVTNKVSRSVESMAKKANAQSYVLPHLTCV